MTLKSKFYFGALVFLGSAGLLVFLVKIASAYHSNQCRRRRVQAHDPSFGTARTFNEPDFILRGGGRW